jgi:hypothetical protein
VLVWPNLEFLRMFWRLHTLVVTIYKEMASIIRINQ